MKGTLCLLQLLVVFLSTFCFGQDVNCTTGDLRLYNSSSSGQGMLQQWCISTNQWTAVCNYNWECPDAIVACRQLGFNDSNPNIFSDGYFGKWDSIITGYYECSGSEDSLNNCDYFISGACDITSYPNRMAGLACHSPPPLEDCADGDLRLVGGESESEGRVEVCYKGGWYSVCGIKDEEASVMCKQLGYQVYPWAAVYTNGRFGKTPPSQGYLQFDCSSQFSEDQWTDCTLSAPACTSCNGDAIKCFAPTECEEGSLRLVDGTIDNEGRVEVCLQGVWGAVCSDSGWQTIDGYVACKQINLGTSGIAPLIHSSSAEFGDGKQPLVVRSPGCSGWENAFLDCSYSKYGSFDCLRSNVAGILCYDDCEDGEIRLVGGASNSEGTVQVCLGNLWGLVAESGWNLADAQVVCSQLGFPLDEVQAVNKSHYGKPKKPVHLSNVHCNGNEQQLLSCTHFEFPTLDDKKAILSHVDVAGVSCQPQNENQTNGNASSGSDSCGLSSTISLLIPAYTTMILVMANLAFGIVAFVMYWKKKPTQSTNSAGAYKPNPVEKPQRTLVPRYELSNKKPPPPIPHPPPVVQNTPMDKDSDELEALYETTEPIDYADMS